MKLEIGKMYVNKKGEVYRITDRFDFEHFPFQGINIQTMMTETFRDDGKWRLSGDSLNDLVSEYTETRTMKENLQAFREKTGGGLGPEDFGEHTDNEKEAP